jgi:hypothetical protein
MRHQLACHSGAAFRRFSQHSRFPRHAHAPWGVSWWLGGGRLQRGVICSRAVRPLAQNLELKNKIKKASDDAEKKRLGDERKALYTAAVAKSDGEKKATAMAHKLLFSKAWRTHCGAHTTDAMCSNETMKKLYGGAAHKAGAKPKGASGASGAKKSKKKKA